MDDQKKLLIVANGESIDSSEISAWQEGASFVIATDGALRKFVPIGVKPDLVIGDLDSVEIAHLEEFGGEVLHLPDQETTDFQKAVSVALSMSATQIVVVGAEGTRFDHTLSALNYASRFSNRAKFRFPMSASIAHLVSEDWSAPAQVGGHVSILPLPEVKFSSSSGLEWPVGGIAMAIGGRDGISNLATQSRISLGVESGCATVFLQRFDGDVVW